jgi:phosphinothricin acetyltransferase
MEDVAPTVDEMERRIRALSESHAWLVAERDGAIAGYAYGGPHRTRAGYRHTCETAVYIDPVHAGTGIGRGLYRELLPTLASKGFHSAIAVIALPGDASKALHKAVGFEEVGVFREAGFKFGQWRDTCWMQCLLTT